MNAQRFVGTVQATITLALGVLIATMIGEANAQPTPGPRPNIAVLKKLLREGGYQSKAGDELYAAILYDEAATGLWLICFNVRTDNLIMGVMDLDEKGRTVWHTDRVYKAGEIRFDKDGRPVPMRELLAKAAEAVIAVDARGKIDWNRTAELRKERKLQPPAGLKPEAGPKDQKPRDLTDEECKRIFNQARDYGKAGQFAEAAALYEKILPSVETIHGKDGTHVAGILHNLAVEYRNMRDYAKAEPLFLRSLKAFEAKLGTDHHNLTLVLENMAATYRDMGQPAKAEPLLWRNLQISEAKFGKDHLEVALVLSKLGNVYLDLEQEAKAEPIFERRLKIIENKYGTNHLMVPLALRQLAQVYDARGQYAKAEPLYVRSLHIRESNLGKDHIDVASTLNDLAISRWRFGHYSKAEASFLRSLQIRESHEGKDHPQVAVVLGNLAGLYDAMGQTDKAISLVERSLRINEAKLPSNDQAIASNLDHLATLYRTKGEHAKAEALYLRSLRIRERIVDPIPSAVAFANLAALYKETGQFEKAESYGVRSMKLLESKLGTSHPDFAHSLYGLAEVYRAMGLFSKADPLFERALKIHQETSSMDRPVVAGLLHRAAWNAASQRKWTLAIDHTQKARQGECRHLADALSALSETEQYTILRKNHVREYHLTLSLGIAAREKATDRSAEWLLNGKAVAHQALAEQQILARDAQDPKAKQLVEDLQTTRSRLAAHVNRVPKPGLEKEYQANTQALRTHEQDLAQKLARTVGRPYRANPWVTLDELRGKLGPKSVFVDIARFPVWDFAANKSLGPRYVAWITPPKGKGDVQLVDLGEAEPIDELVGRMRTTLIESAKAVTKVGDVEAMKMLEKPLKDLSVKVLHPLLPTLEKFDEWIISPDGALWLTPWHALLLSDGKFAVERHLIRHVVSGRDLVLELPKVKAESAYVFADPDFDLAPGKVLAAVEKGKIGPVPSLQGERLKGKIDKWDVAFEFFYDQTVIISGDLNGEGKWEQNGNALTIQTALAKFEGKFEADAIRGKRTINNMTDTFRIDRPRGDELRSAGSLGTLAKAPRLPFTKAEAEAMRGNLKQWLKSEPNVYLDAKASETMLKSVKNPRVLALATHGYFLPVQEVEIKDRPGLEFGEGKRSVLFDKKGQPIENPLLRCGLLLAGCNQRAEAKPGEDDGILTGLEIVGLDLNGCELVVLSACETGIGDVRSGEGVAGLRQAFQLAGAKGVLASLWQVPDRDTALLMQSFYGEIAKGNSQAAALRKAQLQRIADRRTDFAAAHPFYWAAFTLTSRGSE